ncbi:MAG: gliding motility-associated ABC transporter permease subunit GldF [Bacteroidetes bacterium]|nr:gliding motility-associated ABC transporter permease subunit GldF [Bacteroidota bacterium]
MWVIYKKEIRSFLSSLIAYVVMVVFLLATGLFMWIIKGTTVFDLGVASMQVMFDIAPYIFIFLVSAVTMRSFSEERRLGTIETLTTRPVSDMGIIMGKYLACVTLVLFALLPTLVYYYSVHQLGDPVGNVDTGSMWGSYFGLLWLGAAYASIGIFASAVTDNQIVALILSMAVCLFFYMLIGMVGDIKALDSIGKSVEWFGLDYHYDSLSRGVLDTRDVLYFASFSALFIWFTKLVFESRKW